MRRQWWIITRQLRPAARFKSVLRGAKGLPQSPGGARHPTKCCTERKNLQAKQIKRGGWGGTHWSCKHATWWTISAAVRNLMIQTDARRFSYQPPWKNSSVDGERRPFSSGGGEKTHVPRWVFTSIIQISSLLSSAFRARFDVLQETACFDCECWSRNPPLNKHRV